jgi:hypothetical protein
MVEEEAIRRDDWRSVARQPTRSLELLKLAEDACIGVVFRDDALIVEQVTRKWYSLQPGLTLIVRPLRPASPDTLAAGLDFAHVEDCVAPGLPKNPLRRLVEAR